MRVHVERLAPAGRQPTRTILWEREREREGREKEERKIDCCEVEQQTASLVINNT